MPELVLLVVGLAVAAVAVLLPLRGARTTRRPDELEAAEVRHRVALEAIRDVEADRRAGSLDDAAYAAQLAEAETRAAGTRSALDRAASVAPALPATRDVRPVAVAAAVVLGALLIVGTGVPATGLANRTEVNEALAEAQATEAARQDRIRTLTDALRDDPSDADTLSALADAYLAGATEADLVAAASALQVLIALDPGRVDAYERIMTAYLRAGDDANARAAHGSYVALDGADPAEAAFFDGLIALRGENDPDRAATAFERFLELSPDDPRAGMIRGLLEESRGDP